MSDSNVVLKQSQKRISDINITIITIIIPPVLHNTSIYYNRITYYIRRTLRKVVADRLGRILVVGP